LIFPCPFIPLHGNHACSRPLYPSSCVDAMLSAPFCVMPPRRKPTTAPFHKSNASIVPASFSFGHHFLIAGWEPLTPLAFATQRHPSFPVPFSLPEATSLYQSPFPSLCPLTHTVPFSPHSSFCFSCFSLCPSDCLYTFSSFSKEWTDRFLPLSLPYGKYCSSFLLLIPVPSASLFLLVRPCCLTAPLLSFFLLREIIFFPSHTHKFAIPFPASPSLRVYVIRAYYSSFSAPFSLKRFRPPLFIERIFGIFSPPDCHFQQRSSFAPSSPYSREIPLF